MNLNYGCNQKLLPISVAINTAFPSLAFSIKFRLQVQCIANLSLGQHGHYMPVLPRTMLRLDIVKDRVSK